MVLSETNIIFSQAYGAEAFGVEVYGDCTDTQLCTGVQDLPLMPNTGLLPADGGLLLSAIVAVVALGYVLSRTIRTLRPRAKRGN